MEYNVHTVKYFSYVAIGWGQSINFLNGLIYYVIKNE